MENIENKIGSNEMVLKTPICFNCEYMNHGIIKKRS